MATMVKGHYDPTKAIEGMFNGSVTRIGYALKNPADYGPSTKTILRESAKRFHDALDDCEIRLLDAKWYLEHQLRTNRLRREAKAREMGTAAKRKHDEIKDVTDLNTAEQAAPKKAKAEQRNEPLEEKEPAKPKEPAAEVAPSLVNGSGPTKGVPTQVNASQKTDAEKDEKFKQPPPAQAESKKIEPLKPENKEPAPLDDFANPSPPQATPAGTNDDFLESMFDEPTADPTGEAHKDDTEFNFDFNTGDLSGGMDGSGNQDPNSLYSLLPGLESYANQTDDNLVNFGGASTSNNDANPPNPQDSNALPSFSNDFDLPDIGAPNVFDDFLNDDSLGGMDGGAGGNFVDNIDLSDSALLDMDFDNF